VVGFFTTVVGEIESDQAPLVLSKGSGQRPVPVAILARLGGRQSGTRQWPGSCPRQRGHEKRSSPLQKMFGIKGHGRACEDEKHLRNWYQRFGFSTITDRRAPLVRLDQKSCKWHSAKPEAPVRGDCPQRTSAAKQARERDSNTLRPEAHQGIGDWTTSSR